MCKFRIPQTLTAWAIAYLVIGMGPEAEHPAACSGQRAVDRAVARGPPE